MKKILILGCGGSPGINFIKALQLSNEKFYICGVDSNKFFLEMSPVNKRFLVEVNKDEKEYVRQLTKIIEQENIDFIHAQPDSQVRIISKYRNLLPTQYLLPTKKGVKIAQDKLLTYECLLSAKIPVAETVHITSYRVLKTFLRKQKKIVWLRAKTGGGGKASLPIKSFEHGKMWIDYWIGRGLKMSDFIVSEYLPGTEVSWLSIWKNGELICSQQKERLEWVQQNVSPSNVSGTTAIQKTVSYDKVNEVATLTIEAIDKKPNGVYVVDTKENTEEVPCVTEINPGRFFTTSLFFPTAGVNMPYIYVKLGLGGKIKKTSQYNCLPDDIYWIRVNDGGPTIVRGEKWSYNLIK